MILEDLLIQPVQIYHLSLNTWTLVKLIGLESVRKIFTTTRIFFKVLLLSDSWSDDSYSWVLTLELVSAYFCFRSWRDDGVVCTCPNGTCCGNEGANRGSQELLGFLDLQVVCLVLKHKQTSFTWNKYKLQIMSFNQYFSLPHRFWSALISSDQIFYKSGWIATILMVFFWSALTSTDQFWAVLSSADQFWSEFLLTGWISTCCKTTAIFFVT